MELRLGGYLSAFEDAGWSILVVCLVSPPLGSDLPAKPGRDSWVDWQATFFRTSKTLFCALEAAILGVP